MSRLKSEKYLNSKLACQLNIQSIHKNLVMEKQRLKQIEWLKFFSFKRNLNSKQIISHHSHVSQYCPVNPVPEQLQNVVSGSR
jgi:hypothetical protein